MKWQTKKIAYSFLNQQFLYIHSVSPKFESKNQMLHTPPLHLSLALHSCCTSLPSVIESGLCTRVRQAGQKRKKRRLLPFIIFFSHITSTALHSESLVDFLFSFLHLRFASLSGHQRCGKGQEIRFAYRYKQTAHI